MSTFAKVAASIAKSGEYSATDLAFAHRAWAIEMFPLAKNADVALAKFYETETGRLALSDAVKREAAALQEGARIGDADQFISKYNDADKDDAGSVRGGPKVRHADTAKDKNKKRTPSRGVDGDGYTSGGDNDRSNRPINDQTPKYAMANYCDGLASEYAAQHGVSKDFAYGELLKNDKAFGLVWRGALALPAE